MPFKKRFILFIIGFCLFLKVDLCDVWSETTPSATNAPTSTNAISAAADSYRLQAQDKLKYRIEEDPAQSRASESMEIVVSALGDITFPVSKGYDNIISISARGKTVSEVKAELKAKLDADYYQNCNLFLQLASAAPRIGKAQFHGAVRGAYPLVPGETNSVTKAVLTLGYNEFANLKKVKVRRINRETQRSETITVNVQSVLDGKFSEDRELQDGDLVEVPEKGLLIR
jgi:protein involved in polysaccharide export with SLBB domain